MLEMTNILKRYNRQLILDIPLLRLNKGIYWLKGGNGTGKTTFLKMIAGLIPFQGNIIVNSVSQRSAPLAYRRQTSWVEAEPLYPGFLTGNELIALYRQIRDADSDVLTTLIRLLGADSYMYNKTATYSAGMLKKLSLILAFTGNPELILLDEPFITLDAPACDALVQLILERHRQQGRSFILSSHQDPGPDLRSNCRELLINHQTLVC
ncbi:ABC transporter ATP-binding protein [Niabella aurantiaca]|uniref:ABC transporter ATP-binding protein n=1 Tax=Niabella aurantiaca TaxID=379900 RepID=UPI000362F9B2|nr:ATP-binding cassette domain-containing protein [Niabella aurantiaca]